ncbi:MAG: DNRLRE domain-containing protein [Verrucomicrobiota bacterium]
MSRITAGFFYFICAIPALAAEIDLFPMADTCLVEYSPTNNMGGEIYFNAGSNLHGNRNRGLLRFNLSADVPPGSKIQKAIFSIRVVLIPADEPAASIFDLHRLLQPWGEGAKLSNTTGPGRGSPATNNEATWLDRFAFANSPWFLPGAAPTNDFVSFKSAEQFISDTGSSPYYFSSVSSPQLAADVQLWLDNPGTNFGWLLKSRDETTISTARRFGSREDPNQTPILSVTFVAPPVLEQPQICGNQFQFRFLADTGQSYVVEFCNSFSPTNSWTTLTNISPPNASTNILVSDAISSSNRFYRVIPQ